MPLPLAMPRAPGLLLPLPPPMLLGALLASHGSPPPRLPLVLPKLRPRSRCLPVAGSAATAKKTSRVRRPTLRPRSAVVARVAGAAVAAGVATN